jgi:peptide/nickel transport system ATP-binding protein
MAERPILKIHNLTVAYLRGGRWFEALRDVSLSVQAGESLGLVGESGSGKTTLAMAIMRYLGRGGAIKTGKIELAGVDLVPLDNARMRRVWGKQVALVPQNPQSALNPSMRIGEQLAELQRYHYGLDAEQAMRNTLQWLERVNLADPRRVAQSYPHQISGGMQQKVLIAMAMSCEPQLLILDEPTTSLDVTSQAMILDLVRDLIADYNLAVLYVTHNLGVVAQICARVAVLYAGELVEEAPVNDLYQKPLHPYSVGLVNSIPREGETKASHALRGIQGQIPPLGERPVACVFKPRCPVAIELCSTRPELFASGPGRQSRCLRWQEIQSGELDASQAIIPVAASTGQTRPSDIVLDLDELEVHYPLEYFLQSWFKRQPAPVIQAVNQVSLQTRRGQTLGLVGESGSGKTTLARAVMGLVDKTGGEIRLMERSLPSALSSRDMDTLRHLQMVFQNPEEELNPYLTVGETLSRPFITLLGKSQSEARQAVTKLLQLVNLPASYADRLPGQLSGGEIQRIAIARAYASRPGLLVADEPVSSLDVSVQANILNLMNEIQAETNTSLLFISHNLAVVAYLADEVAVIYLGYLMEVSKAGDLFEPPFHPYTEALLAAVPFIDPNFKQKPIRLSGEIPSQMEIPTGCPFHTRCPRALGDTCAHETPPWRTFQENGKRIFCHIPVEELRTIQVNSVDSGRSMAG